MPKFVNGGEQPLVLVIVGPTASGKSALAIKIAKKHNGEIISADSRAIYKYVDIASAKPTEEEQDGIKHWGIDIVSPEDFSEEYYEENKTPMTTPFTAADFKKYAEEKIAEIQKKGKLPIIVGGTGLYIVALVYDYNFIGPGEFNNQTPSQQDLTVRRKLNQKTVEELQNYCTKNNILINGNFYNKRHLIGSIEKSLKSNTVNNKRKQIGRQFIVVGITTENEVLNIKIAQRVKRMISSDIEKEYKKVAKLYPINSEVLKSNAYIVIKKYQNGLLDESEVVNEIIKLDKKLVKKQKTWFKRNEQIIWVETGSAVSKIDELLSKD